MNKTLEGYRLGFIGLGLMGRPMCLNLLRAGARVSAWNRSPGPVEEMRKEGASAAATPAEAASQADILIVMVADTPAVEQVLFGAQGIIEGLRPGTLVIDMGTTAVMPTREFARRIQAAGSDYIDAPVSGGDIGAIAGKLTIMAGGSDAAIARARPLFDVLGAAFTHVGEAGAGQVAKAANQIIVGLNIGAVAEALTLVQRAGVDPGKVREALMGGFAASRILEVHGQRMIDENFTPGARISTQHKDMTQAIELAALYHQRLPATELGANLYKTLMDQGLDNLDHSALIKALQHTPDT